MAGQTVSGTANQLVNEWRPGFYLAANEERVVTDEFNDASEGAQMGPHNLLTLRKVGLSTVQTMSASYDGSSGLTYNTDNPTPATVSPQAYYAAIQWAHNLMTRLQEDWPKIAAAWKQQLLASLATKIDTVGAVLPSTSNTHVVGGAQPLDKSLLANAIQTLAVFSKEHYKVGKTRAHVRVINTQVAAFVQIPELVQAQMSGDGKSTLIKGWQYEVMNADVNESGNVYSSAGVAHNMVYTDEAYVIAFNEKPNLWDPQFYEGMIRHISSMDFGVAVLFDDYAVDLKTAA